VDVDSLGDHLQRGKKKSGGFFNREQPAQQEKEGTATNKKVKTPRGAIGFPWKMKVNKKKSSKAAYCDLTRKQKVPLGGGVPQHLWGNPKIQLSLCVKGAFIEDTNQEKDCFG